MCARCVQKPMNVGRGSGPAGTGVSELSTSNLSTVQSEAGRCGFEVNTGSLSRQFYLRKPNKQKSKKNKQAKVLWLPTAVSKCRGNYHGEGQ